MTIIVNGQSVEVQAGSSLADIVLVIGSKAKGAIVVLNETVVPENLWTAVPVNLGDRLELLSLVAGG